MTELKTEKEVVIIEDRNQKTGITKKYSKGKFLGKGGFAKVYEFIEMETKQLFAAKIIQKQSLTKVRQKQKLITEIKIHRSLMNDFVVQFHSVFEDDQNVYILLEICKNQTLNELIKRRKRITETEVQCYLKQMVSALEYIHKKRVIHRDLKLGNLFLGEDMKIKIGDFGLASRLEFEGEKRRTICGTPNYIAPEVLEGKSGHSFEVDVWSLGVVLYTLVIGKPPFETNDVQTTYKKIKLNQYSFPSNIKVSTEFQELVRQILQTNPSKRPTMQEISQSRFMVRNSGSIPVCLPLSTLACPPSATQLKRFQLASQEQPLSPPSLPSQMAFDNHDLYVHKWVDYSSKYGLGYILNNATVGVSFNDSTKLCLAPGLNHLTYLDKNHPVPSEHNCIPLVDYPPELKKKVTLLNYFKGYLMADYLHPPTQSSSLVYVKKWLKTKKAIIFRLSNSVVQVIFQDNTQIVLNSKQKIVIFLDKKQHRQKYPLNDALKDENAEMTKRLLYTKDILTQMLNNKLQQSHTSNPKHIDKIKSERVNHTLLKSSENFRSQGLNLNQNLQNKQIQQLANFAKNSQTKKISTNNIINVKQEN